MAFAIITPEKDAPQRELNEKEALALVFDHVDPDGEAAERRAYEQLWFGDLAYYIGEVDFVQEGGLIRAPLAPRQHRHRHSANMILPKTLRFLAKLLSIHGQFRVLPRSDDYGDLQASKLSELAFAHAQQVTRFRAKLRRALLWACLCGSGFLKITWNPKAGKPERLYLRPDRDWPDLEASFDGNLRQERERAGRYKDISIGELDIGVPEPFQQWWDPNARGGGFGESRWAATVMAMPQQAIKDQWGVDVPSDASEIRGAELYREVFAFMASGLFGGPLVTRPRAKDLARAIEWFSIPDSKYPQGLKIVIAGGKLIEAIKNPYAASGSPLPFVKLDCFPVEGRFLGHSIVRALRTSQRAYNESRTHAQAMQRTSGYAPTFIPKGSGIKPVQIVAMHGAIFEYNQGKGAPIFGQAPNLPPYIAENASVALAEMNMISAQADPANSKLPGQLRSGDAIRAVQADNNLILSPTADGLLESIAEAGTQMLQLMGLYYDEPRIAQVVGPGGELDPRRFVGADLRGHTTVQVVSQPGQLDSAEAREARLQDAAMLGILDPKNPEHQVILMKGLHFHTSDEFVNAILAQELGEDREIQRMIEEPQYLAPIYPWHDPLLRSKVLERRLNSREFDMLTPLVKEKLSRRWAVFSEQLAQRVQQQMQLQAMMAGTPGKKGEASRPAA